MSPLRNKLGLMKKLVLDTRKKYQLLKTKVKADDFVGSQIRRMKDFQRC